jgi:PAS domain S-box-containing protein
VLLKESTLINPCPDLSFQTLFNTVSYAMLLVNDAGQVIKANSAAQLLLGYSLDSIIGLEVESFIPQRYREHHRHYRKAFNENREVRPMGSGNILSVLTQDGRELNVQIGLNPLQGDIKTYTLVTLQVIDRRRQAEEDLRISEERLRFAREAANLGVFDLDANFNILYWDDRMHEMWGLDSSISMNHKRLLSAIHPEDVALRQAALEQAADPEGSGRYHVEYRVIHLKDGSERWIAAVGRMHFHNGRPTRLVGIARDITEQRTLEKKLQEQRDQAEQIFTQQVAAQTASAIAHEINQPLAAISAYSEVALHALESSAIDTDKLQRALEGCVKQAQRAGNSLHELLAFLQKGDLIKDSLDINEAVREALSIAKNSGFGSFRSTLNLEKNIRPVLGSHTHVIKILVNLLRNAVEAMESSGMPAAAITIKVKTNAETNMAHVSVQDYGPGLSPEIANRMFQPFFTTKPTGIGLGLVVSRALAEANGGQLWVEPSAEPGTIFHFTMPFAP